MHVHTVENITGTLQELSARFTADARFRRPL